MRICVVCKKPIKDTDASYEEYQTGKFVHDNNECYPKVKK